ncbi:MAG TPA: RNA polymerase subunit sigma-70 [Verrucomicrobiales bacterium]|nr:RNA polymerase subunit sigma-70 [Verrucomicrobiales bacterium]|tara:strand:- start:809 stop:1336 length:528 start_codon:yes stop_codon:yes gene_type:complete
MPDMMMNLSDEFILELTQCQQRLYGYIYRRVANRDQAMEVLQKTNLVLCRKADDFEPGTNFNSWAATVAHYQILSYRKTLARDRLVFTEDVLAAIDEGEEENEMREGMLKHLRHCFTKMSDENQALIKLRYERELSMEKLANEIGKKVVAVRVKLHRLRRGLRDCVETRLQEEQA